MSNSYPQKTPALFSAFSNAEGSNASSVTKEQEASNKLKQPIQKMQHWPIAKVMSVYYPE